MLIIDNSDLPFPTPIPEEFKDIQAWIPKCNLNALADKIVKMQKKAKKFGLTDITMRVLEEGIFSIQIASDDGKFVRYRKDKTTYVKVEVIGTAVKLPGDYKLLAVLEHNRIDASKVTDDEMVTNLNVVKTVPGEVCPDSYRYADSFCDHCNVDRYRNRTFVMQKNDGTVKQVGSSCIKDFFGHADPTDMLNHAKWLKLMQTFLGGYTEPGSNYVHEDAILDVLAYTNVAINKFGWVSKGKALELDACPTSSYVVEQMNFLSGVWSPKHKDEVWEKPSKEDYEFAQKAIDWINTNDIKDCTDYIYNCLLLVNNGLVRARDYGVACSIVGSYKGWLARDKEKVAKPVSEHVGVVGKFFDNEAILEKQITFSGFYGVAAFLKFRDLCGNVIVWKTSPQDVEEGKKYRIKGKIKEHSVYGQDKQTIITRAKFEEVV